MLITGWTEENVSGFELTDNAHVKMSVWYCSAELGDFSVHMDS